MHKDNRSYYDAFSKRYEKGRDKGYHRFIDDMEADIARPYVTAKRVLDAGCGTGLVLERLAPMASEALGVDLSRQMLLSARAKGHDVAQADLRFLPFEDASFDAVVSFKVLPHIKNPGRTIEELGRVVKPGGHLVLEFYNKHSLRHVIRRLRPSLKTSKTFDESAIFTDFHTPTEAAELMPEGFDVVDRRGVRGVTLIPATMRWPGLGPLTVEIERRFTASKLTHLGGFLIVVARKAG